jgi:lysozyme
MFIAQMKAPHFTFVVNVNNLAIRFPIGMTMERIVMTPEAKLKLKTLLVKHETYKQFPYTDQTGRLTVGIGRNLSDRGISTAEAFYLLDDDIIYFTDKLSHYLQCFKDLDESRQLALVDMCFNLGLQGFLNFKEMVAALNVHDYVRAAHEMLNSKWAQQVGQRAITLANIIRTGEL